MHRDGRSLLFLFLLFVLGQIHVAALLLPIGITRTNNNNPSYLIIKKRNSHVNLQQSTERISDNDENKNIELYDKNNNMDNNHRRMILDCIMMLTTVCIVPTTASGVVGESSFSSLSSLATTTTEMNNNEMQSKKPFAKLEALLPATRVRRLINRAIQVASSTTTTTPSLNPDDLQIQQLQSMLLKPQNFTQSLSQVGIVPQQPAKSYLDSYKVQRNQLSLLEKPGAMLVQKGEIDAWKRLKRQEATREQGDEIRAAFNIYTSSLAFSGDSYMLNVPKATRSKFIREDTLPDIKNVIASDMGLRYLYRNEVLTAMQDAQAELSYQLQQAAEQNNNDTTTKIDLSDVVYLLRDAQKACDKWFALIDEQDVLEAEKVVAREEQQGKVTSS